MEPTKLVPSQLTAHLLNFTLQQPKMSLLVQNLTENWMPIMSHQKKTKRSRASLMPTDELILCDKTRKVVCTLTTQKEDPLVKCSSKRAVD